MNNIIRLDLKDNFDRVNIYNTTINNGIATIIIKYNTNSNSMNLEYNIKSINENIINNIPNLDCKIYRNLSKSKFVSDNLSLTNVHPHPRLNIINCFNDIKDNKNHIHLLNEESIHLNPKTTNNSIRILNFSFAQHMNDYRFSYIERIRYDQYDKKVYKRSMAIEIINNDNLEIKENIT